MPPTFDPERDREAWFRLGSDLAGALGELGVWELKKVPVPTSHNAYSQARYMDRWSSAEKEVAAEAVEIIEKWSYERRWPALNGYLQYNLQLRLFAAIEIIDCLYIGPGKWGTTLIPYPHWIPHPNLLRWWLIDWYESKGHDFVFWRLQAELWAREKHKWSPEMRQNIKKCRGEIQRGRSETPPLND